MILLALLFIGGGSPALQMWPLPWIVPLAGYLLLVTSVPLLRASFRPWRFGQVGSVSVFAAVFIALVSCAVLIAFQHFTSPDLRRLAALLPVKILGVVVTGISFAILNAVLEEVVFRGVFFDAISPLGRSGPWLALLLTSLLFGIGHMQGYPPGALGAVLAGLFGAALSGLRMYTGGLGLPIAVHIAADAAIFILIARSGAF